MIFPLHLVEAVNRTYEEEAIVLCEGHVFQFPWPLGQGMARRQRNFGSEQVPQHVRARLSVRQKAILDGILAMRHLYRILKMPSAIPISPSPSPKKKLTFGDGDGDAPSDRNLSYEPNHPRSTESPRVLNNPPLLRAS